MQHRFSFSALAALLCIGMASLAQAADYSGMTYSDTARHGDAILQSVLNGEDPPVSLRERGGKGSGYSGGLTGVARSSAQCPPDARCFASRSNPDDGGDPGSVPTGTALPPPTTNPGTTTGGSTTTGTPVTPGTGGSGTGSGAQCLLDLSIPSGGGSVTLPCGGEVAIKSGAIELSPSHRLNVVPVSAQDVPVASIGVTCSNGDNRTLKAKRDVMRLIFQPAQGNPQFQTASDGNGLVVSAAMGQLATLPIGTELQLDFGASVTLPDGGTLSLPGQQPNAASLPPGTVLTVDAQGNATNAQGQAILVGNTPVVVPAGSLHNNLPYAVIAASAVILPQPASLPVGSTRVTGPNVALGLQCN